MVPLSQHCGNLNGHKITMEVMYGGKEIPLSEVRLCGMDVIPSIALCEPTNQVN